MTAAGLAGSTAAVVVLHVLRSDLRAPSSRLSAYATGPHGEVMTFAFLALAVGVLAFASAVWARSRPVAGLVGVAGVGLLLSAVYPTGVSPAAETMHSAASTVATVCLTAAAAAASLWRAAALQRTLPSRLLAGGALVALLVSPVLHTTAYSGLGQRVLWLLLVAWMSTAVVAARPVAQRRERMAARHSKNMEYT